MGRRYEGAWEGATDEWIINYSKDTNRFSSSYFFETGIDYEFGYERGYFFMNGIAAASTWYESGTYRGIDLLVLKNEDAFYGTYWGIDSMASFDYSTYDVANTGHGINRRIKKSIGAKIGLDLSERNECMLSDYESREVCVRPKNGGLQFWLELLKRFIGF